MAGRIAYYGGIVTNGLVLALDAAKKDSYPGSGTVWRDISGNGNNGTLTNGPTFNSANGGSIVFDGINDYVIHPTINLGTISSWSVWVKYNSLAGEPVILGSNSIDYYSLFYFPGGKIFYVNYGGSLASLSYPTGLLLSTWYNITQTRSGLTIKVYLNGIDIGTMSGGSPTSPTIFSVIGAERTGAYFSNINMGSTLIYNRALSAAEVLQNYNATKGRFGL
jgi:hypothetical protein